MTTRDQGTLGERIAEAYLRRKGYRIIARQWRSPLGEIDLVAEKGNRLIFVEVKTRWSETFGEPEEAIRGEKARRLARLAELYLKIAGAPERAHQVDVVAVKMDAATGTARIRHIPDAVGGRSI